MSSTPVTAALFLMALVVITGIPASAARTLLAEQLPTFALAPSPSNSADDLISTACQRAQYRDVCSSTLRSYPGSHNADLHGLAAISLDLAITHARETLVQAKHLGKGGNYSNTYSAECLRDCQDQYRDAISDLGESKRALRQGVYDTVNTQVSGAMSEVETCEDGFAEKPGYTSPLTERNEYFQKLCSNSLAITSLLVA